MKGGFDRLNNLNAIRPKGLLDVWMDKQRSFFRPVKGARQRKPLGGGRLWACLCSCCLGVSAAARRGHPENPKCRAEVQPDGKQTGRGVGGGLSQEGRLKRQQMWRTCALPPGDPGTRPDPVWPGPTPESWWVPGGLLWHFIQQLPFGRFYYFVVWNVYYHVTLHLYTTIQYNVIVLFTSS